jgi:hypothetical protein
VRALDGLLLVVVGILVAALATVQGNSLLGLVVLCLVGVGLYFLLDRE